MYLLLKGKVTWFGEVNSGRDAYWECKKAEKPKNFLILMEMPVECCTNVFLMSDPYIEQTRERGGICVWNEAQEG